MNIERKPPTPRPVTGVLYIAYSYRSPDRFEGTERRRIMKATIDELAGRGRFEATDSEITFTARRLALNWRFARLDEVSLGWVEAGEWRVTTYRDVRNLFRAPVWRDLRTHFGWAMNPLRALLGREATLIGEGAALAQWSEVLNYVLAHHHPLDVATDSWNFDERPVGNVLDAARWMWPDWENQDFPSTFASSEVQLDALVRLGGALGLMPRSEMDAIRQGAGVPVEQGVRVVFPDGTD